MIFCESCQTSIGGGGLHLDGDGKCRACGSAPVNSHGKQCDAHGISFDEKRKLINSVHVKELSTGLLAITQERARQIELGFTPEHDECRSICDLVNAANSFARAAALDRQAAKIWYPWDKSDAPEAQPDLIRSNLAKAGALIAAAIDLYDRQEARDKVIFEEPSETVGVLITTSDGTQLTADEVKESVEN